MSQKAEQKAKSYEAILASAASFLRERGIRASSVAEVMKGANLTVGGFYSHFDSKESLFREAIRTTASRLWSHLVQSTEDKPAGERALWVVRRYLSRKHRDNPAEGCLLPSIAPEVAREGEPYRSTLEAQISTFADSLGSLVGEGAANREKALALFALMFGALSLSRVVKGFALSDEILAAAKKLAAEALSAPPATTK